MNESDLRSDVHYLGSRRPTVGRQVFWGALLHNYQKFRPVRDLKSLSLFA